MKKVNFTCDSCGKFHSIDISGCDYKTVGSEERQMGAEIVYEGEHAITCDCGAEISVLHRFWEYPEGSPSNHEEFEINGGTEA